MKSRLLFLVFALVLAVGMVLTGCAAPAASTEPVASEKPSESVSVEPTEAPVVEEAMKVAVITPDPANAFFATEEAIAKPLLESMGYEVIAMVHLEDAATLSNHFDTAIAAGVKAIVCDGTGGETDIAAVQRATDAGIGVFLIDREITENGIAKSQLVANNLQGAEAVGEYFVEMMGETGGYIELLGKDVDTNAHVRSQGYHNKIDPYTDMVLLDAQTANWSMTEGQSVMETMIQKHGDDIKGVICGNDTMCMGAVAALQNAGMTDVICMGFDGSNDVRDAILAGTAQATGLQQIAYITQLACEQADKWIKTGEAPAEERQLVDCLLINKDNASKLDNFVFTE